MKILSHAKIVSGIILFLLFVSMLAFAFGSQHVEATTSTSSVPPANYDEQLGMTFTQNFLNIAYNVTAVAQNDTYGYGPAYFLNGLSNQSYWYQVGLSYNWPRQAGGYNSGFHMNYEVFNSSGFSVFPISGQGGGLATYSGPVNIGDSVLLNLYFSGGNVIMYSHDWNTGASATENYTAENATFFMGNPSGAGNEFGFFTGLMTEEYHPSPYYGGEQFVTYSNNVVSLSSAWLWIGEYYTTQNQTLVQNQTLKENQNLFWQSTSLPVNFDNYHQLHEFSANGTTEYADAYTFRTGKDPFSINLTAQQVDNDAGMETRAQIFVTSSGGTAPYTYLIFLDNTLIGTYSMNSSTYNANVDFGQQEIGSHVYYVNVVDSKGYQASSESMNFTVKPDPVVSVSLAPSASSNNIVSLFTNFFTPNSIIQANASVSGGISPYVYEWYLNGVPVEQTIVSSHEYRFTTMGTYQLQVNITDADGFSTESQIFTVQYSYNAINIGLVFEIAIIIGLLVFFFRRRARRLKLISNSGFIN